MKRLGMLLLAVVVVGWALPYNVDQVDPEGPSPRPIGTPLMDRTFIDSVGDIRAIMGAQGKSICVSGGGEAIAVLYGGRSGDPDNSMRAQVAYSLDGGATWTVYGPFGNPPARRLYNDVVGTPDFHTNPGELFFIWQENTLGYNDGVINVMIEEMTVEAALTGDPTLVFQAAAYDPLSASVLSLAEIKQMVNEMLQQNRDHLPQFERFVA